ncbi:MAG TPA: ATP-binding protein [Chloroflexota bacterium]|nr:ATP-binding protein [Chloroflexota bacterium]
MRRLAGYVSALVAVGIVTGAIGLASTQVHLANASMLYLIAVSALGIFFGKGPAVVASMAAFLAFDFFFIQPIHTLTVTDPEEWIALLVLLFTAVATGQLAAAQRQRAREAEAREREAIVLYDVGRTLSESDLDQALPAVSRRLRRELNLDAVAIEVHGASGGRIERAEVGAPYAVEATRHVATQPAMVLGTNPEERGTALGVPGHWFRAVPSSTPRSERRHPRRLHVVPIHSRDRQIGRLILVRVPGATTFARSEDRMLLAVTNQIGQAVERSALRREAMEADVLQRADSLKTALLNAVSHDLRTPLASIIASASSLRQHDVTWSEDERDAFAEAIEQEATRLNRIVGSLLDLSRIQGGSLHPQRDWYDLGSLIDDVVGRLGPGLGRCTVTTDVPSDLPPVFVDSTEIDQVLSNLLENATKHTPCGTEVRVAARTHDDEIEVEVTDAGPGIPPDALGQLFDPFYTLSATGGQPRGIGLGLAIAKGLVEAHAGRIWAENRTEGGARFVFTLPARTATSVQGEP